MNSPLKQKMSAYNIPQQIEKLGLYPFFRTIESEQDTVVKIGGKDILMFGSNSYLGLTNHPKLKEASIAAINKYGSGCAGSRAAPLLPRFRKQRRDGQCLHRTLATDPASNGFFTGACICINDARRVLRVTSQCAIP